MGELEKYGLLSLASVAVLFLVLTFVRRDLDAQELKRRPTDPPEEPVVLLASPPEVAPARTSAPPVTVRASGDASAEPAPPPPATRAPETRRGEDEGAANPPVPAAPPETARRRSVPSAPPIVASSPASVATAPRGAALEPAADSPRTVVVQEGDTLYRIAERELGAARRWPEIVAANSHLDPKRLLVGEELALPLPAPAPRPAPALDPAPRRATKALPSPKARSHRVAEGDTLSGIAHRYYGDARLWDRVLQANRARITDPRRLRIGTVLSLP